MQIQAPPELVMGALAELQRQADLPGGSIFSPAVISVMFDTPRPTWPCLLTVECAAVPGPSATSGATTAAEHNAVALEVLQKLAPIAAGAPAAGSSDIHSYSAVVASTHAAALPSTATVQQLAAAPTFPSAADVLEVLGGSMALLIERQRDRQWPIAH